jgi:pyruvate dehydrogenase E2 component (dihydrolipoamide acetyltransferase)
LLFHLSAEVLQLSRPRPDQQEFDLEPLTATRQAIAERTAQSFATKPHFSMTCLVDASAMVALRERLRAAAPSLMPTYNDIIMKACARVLPSHRRMNAWLDDEGLKLLRHVNIAFPTATDAGVLMPVILDADQKSLPVLAAETHERVALARDGKLRASLQMGAGFSLSNIGPGRVEWFTAIISPPQVAILSVGALAERPVVRDGGVVARPTLHLTLTVDHRAVDGADSAAFLRDLIPVLEDADALAAACGV